MSNAEYERLLIGARTKSALKAKKDRGQRTGHIPFGKRFADAGRWRIPIQELKRIFAEGIEG